MSRLRKLFVFCLNRFQVIKNQIFCLLLIIIKFHVVKVLFLLSVTQITWLNSHNWKFLLRNISKRYSVSKMLYESFFVIIKVYFSIHMVKNLNTDTIYIKFSDTQLFLFIILTRMNHHYIPSKNASLFDWFMCVKSFDNKTFHRACRPP